jgi:hypothetical protein
MADEEDMALSAFDSFCRRAARGLFPRLEDRDDLWQLLYVLTVRKAIVLARHQGRARRGPGRITSLEDLAAWDLDAVLGREPAPELAAQMAEEYQRLLDRLGERRSAPWPGGRWRAGPTARSRPGSAASRRRSSANFGRSAGSGLGR